MQCVVGLNLCSYEINSIDERLSAIMLSYLKTKVHYRDFMQRAKERILVLYGLSCLLGILTGTVGSLFQLTLVFLSLQLKHFFSFLQMHHYYVPFYSGLVSMIFVFIAWLMVRYAAPEAAGSGVQEIEGVMLHQRPIFWRRLLPVKFIGGSLSIAANMVLGREGPTIQMGGNLGEMLGEYANINRNRRDILVAAGAAAGLATAFNAPLAGVLFVIEEMREAFKFSFINFKMVALCAVSATVVLHLMIGANAAIPMAVFQLPSLVSLWLFWIFGIVLGFAGLLFNKVLIKTLYWLDTLPIWVKFLYVPITGFLVGLLAIWGPQAVGGGYDIIEQGLTNPLSLSLLLLLFVVRFVATIGCYATGVPGGIFAPLLALGALLGFAGYSFFEMVFPIFAWDKSIHAGMFAVAGMGALFSACIRAPITGIVLIVEMTQNYQLILPLMVSCLTSTTIVQLADNAPIYTQLLKRTLRLSQAHD